MNHLTWVTARVAGLTAWGLLSASVILGLLSAVPVARRSIPTATARRTHQWVSIAALAVLGLHLGAIVADTYVHFDALDLLVPLASGWRRVAVALGVVAMWALAAVSLSTAVRSHIRPSTWRAIHLLGYLAYVAATIHLLTAGADAAVPGVRLAVVLVTAAVAVLSLVALSHHDRTRARAGARVRTERTLT